MFGPTVTAAVPPPPISGGTMRVTHDGHTVVVADPDRDLVYVVDVAARALLRTIALQPGDEPGRVAEDGAGRVHVALRSGGALVTLDPASGAVLARRAVCPAPRGVAWDETTDSVLVACATGELVTLPAAGGAPTRTVKVERDLRDVIVQEGAVSVSTFRAAEVLRLAPDGSVVRRDTVAGDPGAATFGDFVPHVAWRTFADAAGNTVVVHQLHAASALPPLATAYYADIDSPGAVLPGMTVLRPDGTRVSDSLLGLATLPVDVAITPDGKYALVAAAGNALTPALWTVLYVPLGAQDLAASLPVARLPGPAIAVAFDGSGEALVQTREPATLWVVYPGTAESTPIPLSTLSRADTGQAVFHAQAGGLIACASCHPEGGDDGHVWILDDQPRRTPSLRGTIAGTAPYHWAGDEADFHALVDDVYTNRMAGAKLATDTMGALEGWVERLPAPPAPSWVDATAARRGRQLFESDATGCASCHTGARLTNNATVGIGTGGAFQVPPLVGVGWRTPLLHDGCATTLADRFGRCATPEHGSTSTLSAGDVSDPIAYLETL